MLPKNLGSLCYAGSPDFFLSFVKRFMSYFASLTKTVPAIIKTIINLVRDLFEDLKIDFCYLIVKRTKCH